MKNILLLVPRMNIGGAESYVALVARSLKSLGYNILLLLLVERWRLNYKKKE